MSALTLVPLALTAIALMVVAMALATGRTERAARQRLLETRETLSEDDLVAQLADADLPREHVLAAWTKVAEVLHVEAGKLRAADTTLFIRGPMQPFHGDLDVLEDVLNEHRVEGMPKKVVLKTIGDTVRLLADGMARRAAGAMPPRASVYSLVLVLLVLSGIVWWLLADRKVANPGEVALMAALATIFAGVVRATFVLSEDIDGHSPSANGSRYLMVFFGTVAVVLVVVALLRLDEYTTLFLRRPGFLRAYRIGYVLGAAATLVPLVLRQRAPIYPLRAVGFGMLAGYAGGLLGNIAVDFVLGHPWERLASIWISPRLSRPRVVVEVISTLWFLVMPLLTACWLWTAMGAGFGAWLSNRLAKARRWT
jgi:hypothetical protein